ncbi:flagellar export protein FliJ [Peribacillus asahii]|uniref:Flagellar FliJ protein n=1 Tax=Peribacillus asahii TaxID=228899 RepID=A0A3Q9RML0_9BACI|nr:flagellar export protein FliJ [Peribacillus asahii]AZV42274.1 flagellar biosynthesis chaperone [Peribacillus asahii]USK61961.1 flagellar biosynthesis chaperone FliJ [Peribacillus asahii]USK87270.1 flagellar biosynthesis chaperone FliJ [Peribacillus asahii]
MIYQYKFEKILTIKEKEKSDARAAYNEALKNFEQVAEKLYKLLKKKEELLDYQQVKLTSGLSVQEIRHNQLFMGNLEKLIEQCQKDVIEARYRMNLQQERLKEKNIEVKKYEKIKEKDFQKFLEVVKEAENKQMDEISIQQFLSKG